VELRQIIDTVKHLDYEHKTVSNAVTMLDNSYQEKLTDLTGGGHLTRLKQALSRLQAQNTDNGISEGVMA